MGCLPQGVASNLMYGSTPSKKLFACRAPSDNVIRYTHYINWLAIKTLPKRSCVHLSFKDSITLGRYTFFVDSLATSMTWRDVWDSRDVVSLGFNAGITLSKNFVLGLPAILSILLSNRVYKMRQNLGICANLWIMSR